MSLPRSQVVPAPGRGRYNRRRSALERAEEQRRRLLQACAELLATEAVVQVDSVVKRASVGRNTFYAHFADVETAIEQVDQSVLDALDRLLDQALSEARTPLARLRATLEVLVTSIAEHPYPSLAALRPRVLDESWTLSPVGEWLRQALRRTAREAQKEGLFARAPDEARLLAACAAIEALGRWLAWHQQRRDHALAAMLDAVIGVFR